MLSFKQIPADVAKGWHSDGEPAWAKSFKAADRLLRYKRYSRDAAGVAAGVAAGYWLPLWAYVAALAAAVLLAALFGVLAFRNYIASRLAIQEADEKVKIIPLSELPDELPSERKTDPEIAPAVSAEPT